jgi:hypothetical protein
MRQINETQSNIKLMIYWWPRGVEAAGNDTRKK